LGEMRASQIAPWILGIDPGFTETGVVLLDPQAGPMAWATFSLKKGEDLERAISLGVTVVEWIKDQIVEWGFGRMRIGIEMPIVAVRRGPSGAILSMNVTTYLKQARLVQEIEAGLMALVVGNMWWAELVEVNNTTSKKRLTGSGRADKSMMVAASPFKDVKPVHTAEALADAYAHALVAIDDEQPSILTHMTLRTVQANIEGKAD